MFTDIAFFIYSTHHLINKSQRVPKGKSKMDNPEKLATQFTQDDEKQTKNTTQYMLDTAIRKQAQIT